jgi:hypothetical protein
VKGSQADARARQWFQLGRRPDGARTDRLRLRIVGLGAATRGTHRGGALIVEEVPVTATIEQRLPPLETAAVAEPVEARYATVRIVVAAACLLGAQFLHWSVIDQHAREWSASGDFFFILALVESLTTVLIIARMRPWIAAAAIVVSVVPVLVWAWDRALGLPFGPTKGVRGTIGRSDVMSVVFELITIVVLWPFLRRAYGERTPGRIDVVGKVVIGATCVYVAGFSVWAMFADQGVIHHVAPTTVTAVNQPGTTSGDLGPLNTAAP